jgi:hypothetical protein
MTLIKVLINCQIRTDGFSQLIESFLKLKIPLLELSINCQIRTDGFSQLIESLNNGILSLKKHSIN